LAATISMNQHELEDTAANFH